MDHVYCCGLLPGIVVFVYAAGRELLRRSSAARMRETNPKCQVVADIRGDNTAPVVDVAFGECCSPWGQSCVYCECIHV